jgi:hypothetical protein
LITAAYPIALGGHHWNRLADQRSQIGDGGFADHEAALNLALQSGRAVVIEAGHQHGASLIRKIVRGLTWGGNKGLECGEPFRIVEREQRNVLGQFQPRFPEGSGGRQWSWSGSRRRAFQRNKAENSKAFTPIDSPRPSWQ